MKRALIFGVGGQDGSYLADLLLERGVEVHGTTRRSSVDNLPRIAHRAAQLTLHRADLSDPASIVAAVREAKPDAVFNMADQDNVGWSEGTPGYSVGVTAGGAGSVLDACRRFAPEAQVFQPTSATMFGNAPAPQNELTTLNPLSPYACAKAHAYHLARYYRQVHGMRVSTAILYNHDSPRRGAGYLLQTICRGALSSDRLVLNDLNAVVDIGYAKEYMEAVLRIVDLNDDFVISGPHPATVRDICEYVYWRVGRTMDVVDAGKRVTTTLRGDSSKATVAFGYRPQTTVYQVADMILEKLQCAS